MAPKKKWTHFHLRRGDYGSNVHFAIDYYAKDGELVETESFITDIVRDRKIKKLRRQASRRKLALARKRASK